MADLSKIRKNGVDYNLKDTTARADIEALKKKPTEVSGGVKTVNGVSPDENGNVQIEIDRDSVDKEVLPHVVLFGDSITDPNGMYGIWPKILPNYAKFASLRNYARATATFTFKSDTEYNITDKSANNVGNNVIWNQFNRLKHDVDNGGVTPNAIIILAGTNDIIQSKPIGDVNTAFTGSILDKDIITLTNFAQSIRYTCECIKQEYPMCQIILCTPWQISYGGGGVAYRDAIVSCAQKLSEKYIDVMYESGIYQYFETTGDVFKGSDGVHLNDRGAVKFAQYIAREMYNKVNLRELDLTTEEQTKIPATSIFLSSTKLTFTDTKSQKITATVEPSNSTDVVVWKSSATNIATVNGGTVYPIANGTAIITATAGSVSATCEVTVNVEEEIVTYSISRNLTNCTSSNSATSVTSGNALSEMLTANDGYTMDGVTVTMGGVDITATAYVDGVVSIASVTGDVVIIAEAVESVDTSNAVSYYRNSLNGSFNFVINNDGQCWIPSTAIPAGTLVEVAWNAQTDSSGIIAYGILNTETKKFKTEAVYNVTPTAGENKLVLNVEVDHPVHFAFKPSATGFLEMELHAATSSNQDWTNAYAFTGVPAVGSEVGVTLKSDSTLDDIAFDVLVKAIPA